MSAAEPEVLEVSPGARHGSGERSRPAERIDGIVIGTLVALAEQGARPLVMYPNQPGNPPGPVAIPAAAIVDVHAGHIGRQVVLQFVQGDPKCPVIMGLLRAAPGWPLSGQPGQVEVDVDGERMIIGAREQLVLKCGAASITLTRAGKILIEGAYVSNRSAGVMRIKGGSVQIN